MSMSKVTGRVDAAELCCVPADLCAVPSQKTSVCRRVFPVLALLAPHLGQIIKACVEPGLLLRLP